MAIEKGDPEENVNRVLADKGEEVYQRFFKHGFVDEEDAVWDILVHRNPARKDDGSYNFNAVSCTYSFASPYVVRRLLQLKGSAMETEARNKYSADTFRRGEDGNNGNEFALLCLYGSQISDIEFLAQPLTDNAQPTILKFPPTQVLALDWLEREKYLEAKVLYIPSYSNLESGGSFCLMELNGRWTLVVVQCTTAEKHPVEQDGLEIIYDCFTKKRELKVDEMVIVFMTPVHGKLKAQQPLVTKEGGVGC